MGRRATTSAQLRLGAFAGASAPWSWFAVRDLGPWADVVAIFLPAILVPVGLAVALALVVRRLGSWFVAVSWLLFAGVAIAGPWWPLGGPRPTAPLRLVATNVLGANRDVASAARDLVTQQPDVLVVSEDSTRLDRELRGSFTHALSSDAGGRGTAVYTDLAVERLPLPPRLDGRRAVRVRVDAPARPFVLYAIHLPRPWPHRTSDFQVTPTEYRGVIEDLATSIRSERLPVVVAGDLNLVDRTSWYRRMTAILRDATRSSWAGPTSRKWWPLLARIDHIFEARTWCSSDAHRFAITGSDHRGVAASIGPCPASR